MVLDPLHSLVTTANDGAEPGQNANDDTDDGSRREIAATATTASSSFVAGTPVSPIPSYGPDACRVASVSAVGSVAVSSPVASLGVVF